MQEYSGSGGYLLARRNIYDIIILDLMLPEMSGYDVLKKLREENIFTPVLILTAKDGLEDKLKGFNYGADDYLVKPFESKELLARLEAIIRRSKNNYRPNILKFKDMIMNLDTRQVTINQREVILLGKQFDMLEYLIGYKDTIITKKLIQNTFINFIIFTLILLIFDFIIYNQVLHSLYKDVDMMLENAIQRFGEEHEPIEKPNDIPDRRANRRDDEIELNPRLIFIERDIDGNIKNEDELGNFSNYIDDIKFNFNNIGNIYNIQIGEQYSYRCINFETVQNEEKMYIQVLVNVDGEVDTLENILNILVLGTSILVVISIGLSYILSKRTMKPIIESYRRQTEFVQNASHELRTPLTIIQAKQELLLTQPNEKIIDKSEDINLTLKETRRLTKLIKELMDLARADNSKEELKKESVDINKLIDDISKPYIEIAQMQGKKIEFDLRCNKPINANISKINELMIIILDNAIKYTNDGDLITIKTYFKDGKCNVEIQDTGIGISDEGLEHIFDRFYREDKARSRETGGNGLGLAIAKTIVNMHGGTIKAMHNKPKGTIILIKI